MLRGTSFEKKILYKRSPISDNGCDVYMLNSAIEYNDCVKWSSLGQFPTLLPLVRQMNSPTLKSCYWLRLLLHVDSKYSVSFNQIWIWIIFSDWFANIEAFCSDRAISWIAWCQMSFVNAFYWSYCERFNHAPFIFFYNIFFTLIVFNQWQTSVIQTSDSYILDFPNHLGQSNPPIYHKRLLNMQSDVPPSNQKPVKKNLALFFMRNYRTKDLLLLLFPLWH